MNDKLASFIEKVLDKTGATTGRHNEKLRVLHPLGLLVLLVTAICIGVATAVEAIRDVATDLVWW